MNKFRIKGNWNVARGKIKLKMANLRDNESLFKQGQEEVMLGRHQKRIGEMKSEIHTLLKKI